MTNRKTIVKRISNLIIVKSDCKLKIIDLASFKLNEQDVKGKFKILKKISENPLEILKLKGSKKINLILLILYEENVKNSNISAKNFDISAKNCKMTSIQSLIYKLLIKKKKTWKKIEKANKDLAESLKLQFNRKSNKKSKSVQSLDLNTKESYFSNELYGSMISCILNDKKEGKILPSHPFYPEIDVYNDYLLSLHDISTFDTNLLKREFTTINERGIRDFVKRKLEEANCDFQ